MGDCWWRALWVSRSILNLIRSETGSQWRSNKIGVMWSYLREPVISRAAAFCTDWSFLMTYFGTLYKRELQWSNLKVIKAWTRVSLVLVGSNFFYTGDVSKMIEGRFTNRINMREHRHSTIKNDTNVSGTRDGWIVSYPKRSGVRDCWGQYFE